MTRARRDADIDRLCDGVMTVLLVEDEPLVRDMVRAFLERAGYGVEAVGTAEEVLDGWSDRAVDLLLTDVMLPGRTGVELATALRQQRPELKVVYMSGNVSDPAARESVLSPDTRFLAKPFSRAMLLEAIRSLLAEGSERQ
ncbi:MAG: response regulator [Vicinamibacterales bacterium]